MSRVSCFLTHIDIREDNKPRSTTTSHSHSRVAKHWLGSLATNGVSKRERENSLESTRSVFHFQKVKSDLTLRTGLETVYCMKPRW